MRQGLPTTTTPQITFQFTHPGKGATPAGRAVGDGVRVSIHAPWEGCDGTLTTSVRPHSTFQFTHPGKGATSSTFTTLAEEPSFNSRTLGRVRLKRIDLISLYSVVSIHAPWEGCDRRALSEIFRSAVSIHAPWEGCDTKQARH